MKSDQRSVAGLAIVILSMAVACDRASAPALVEDTPENRSAQIERYFAAMPPEALVTDMVDNIATRLPDDQRAHFVDLMKKNVDVPKLRSIMQEGMAKNFTAGELSALADFYGSELGKSANEKFGTYMAEVMPAVQAEIVTAVGKVQGEFAAKQEPSAPPATKTEPAPEAAAPAPAEMN